MAYSLHRQRYASRMPTSESDRLTMNRRRDRPQRRQSTVLLQRRTDYSVPVHMHSFLDHGGLRDPRRPLAGLTFAAHFL